MNVLSPACCWLLVLLLGFVGCGSKDDPQTGDAAGDTATSDATATTDVTQTNDGANPGSADAADDDAATMDTTTAGCTTTADCPGEKDRCIGGTCIPETPCQSDKQCIALDMVCDGQAGLCVQCLAPADCPSGQLCKAHSCIAPPTPCASSKECGSNQVCDKLLGGCVECVSADDCKSGQRCHETLCVPLACTPNQTLCDDGTLAICAADGSGWSKTPCPTGQLCVGNGCKALLCTPGEVACDGSKIRTCDSSGTTWQDGEDCAKAGELCLGGACVAKSCTAGAALCKDAATLATCKADGSGWGEAPCGTGTACVGTECVATICTPGASSCAGAQVATCDATGTKLLPGEDCDKTGKDCSAGACVAKPPKGWQVHGAFLGAADSFGGGYRVSEQGFGGGSGCAGGYCVHASVRP
ncbi:MAG: hypothetical protein H6747_13045 [Deltaproteobacteria bacterium]|nr:hypothetical protein [Deltaproteobacteria bacterium]